MNRILLTILLQSQLQRAAVSVASNIAEGLSRKTDKEQLRFVEIAYSSLIETYAQISISQELGYINKEQLYSIKKDIFKIYYICTKFSMYLNQS